MRCIYCFTVSGANLSAVQCSTLHWIHQHLLRVQAVCGSQAAALLKLQGDLESRQLSRDIAASGLQLATSHTHCKSWALSLHAALSATEDMHELPDNCIDGDFLVSHRPVLGYPLRKPRPRNCPHFSCDRIL